MKGGARRSGGRSCESFERGGGASGGFAGAGFERGGEEPPLGGVDADELDEAVEGAAAGGDREESVATRGDAFEGVEGFEGRGEFEEGEEVGEGEVLARREVGEGDVGGEIGGDDLVALGGRDVGRDERGDAVVHGSLRAQ